MFQAIITDYLYFSNFEFSNIGNFDIGQKIKKTGKSMKCARIWLIVA